MSIIYGKGLSCATGEVNGLKWTVSLEEPAAPKAGDLWVQADPTQVQLRKVIQLQTPSSRLENMEPYTLYVLVPEEGYLTATEPVMVEYFNSDKYALRLKCPYILLTDSAGAEVALPRGVYTGEDWRMWGLVPEKPTSWRFLAAINADSTWTPPKENAWYRVHVFGKCGDGGFYSSFGTVGYSNAGMDGFAGGNTGGMAGSELLLHEPVVCTVNGSVTSFGDFLSATSGGSGMKVTGQQQYTMEAQAKQPSEIVGAATGGTLYNSDGTKGAVGGESRIRYRYDDEDDTEYPNGHIGGSGGAGARFSKPWAGFPYVDNTTAFRVGTGSEYTKGSNGNAWDGIDAASYPALNLEAPVLYGGGQGGGGIAVSGSLGYYETSGKNSVGSPGLIIIEIGEDIA